MSGYVQRLADAATTTLGDVWPAPATRLPDELEAPQAQSAPRAPRAHEPAPPQAHEPPALRESSPADDSPPAPPRAREAPPSSPPPARANDPSPSPEPPPVRARQPSPEPPVRGHEPLPPPPAPPPARERSPSPPLPRAVESRPPPRRRESSPAPPRVSRPEVSSPPRERPAAANPTFAPSDVVDVGSVGGADRWRELGQRLLAEHPPRPTHTPAPAPAPAGEAPPEVVIEYLDVRVLAPEPAAPALGPPRGGAWQGRP